MTSAGRWLVARYVGQFAFAGLVAVAIVGVATSVASRRVGEREAISEARTTTLIKAEGLIEPLLTDSFVANEDPTTTARLTAVIRRDVLDESLLRVKIWRADGLILASDESRLVGRTFDLGDEETDAMVSGRINAEVSDLAGPENLYERDIGTKLLEVYLPVHAPDGDPLLFEAYYRYNTVQANGSRLWRSFAPIALGALVMLELVQIPLAWSLARRLRQRLQEREGLLRHALEASEVERRHIASDLHDGVVQDLSGVAYALSASARSGEVRSAADAEALASTVRESIRSLRSLVIDLYPPNLREEGLASALLDLVERARESGADVELDVAELPADLPESVAALVYRAAQEALRNAVQHADAGFIRVRVALAGGRTVLQVTDDGRGFDQAMLAAREAEGHVGLRALRGLVGDGGGTVAVDARAREGDHRGGRGAAAVIRVMVADDHAVIRSGLQQLLSTADDIELVGTVTDGAAAVAMALAEQPDVALMDLSMPVLDGIEATRQITSANPRVHVVVLTSFSDNRRILEALKAGATGYLLKHAGPDELLNGIRAAAAGDAPLDPKAARVMLESSRATAARPDLTVRELEVLRLVAAGDANKQIARKLGITERTVKSHLTSIFSAIAVTSRTQAALWAKQHLTDDR